MHPIMSCLKIHSHAQSWNSQTKKLSSKTAIIVGLDYMPKTCPKFTHVSSFVVCHYDCSITNAAPPIEWPDDVMNVELEASFSKKIPVCQLPPTTCLTSLTRTLYSIRHPYAMQHHNLFVGLCRKFSWTITRMKCGATSVIRLWVRMLGLSTWVSCSLFLSVRWSYLIQKRRSITSGTGSRVLRPFNEHDYRWIWATNEE